MVKCHICNAQTSSTTKVRESRYFNGEQIVCTSCFDRWAVSDYEELDRRAIAKVEKFMTGDKYEEN